MTARSASNNLAIAALLVWAASVDAIDPASTIRTQVHEVQRIHRGEGMAGLEAASRECWGSEGGFRCLHLDVAAGTLDRNFADAMGIGGHPYFEVDPLLQRSRPVFERAGWDMETSNAYLQFLDASIRAVLVELQAP